MRVAINLILQQMQKFGKERDSQSKLEVEQEDKKKLIALYKRIGTESLYDLHSVIPDSVLASPIRSLPSLGIPLDPLRTRWYSVTLYPYQFVHSQYDELKNIEISLIAKLIDIVTNKFDEDIRQQLETIENSSEINLKLRAISQIAELLYLSVHKDQPDISFFRLFEIEGVVDNIKELQAKSAERTLSIQQSADAERQARKSQEIQSLQPTIFELDRCESMKLSISELREWYDNKRVMLDSAETIIVLGEGSFGGIGDFVTGPYSFAWLLSQMKEFSGKQIVVVLRRTPAADKPLSELFNVPQNIMFVDSKQLEKVRQKSNVVEIKIPTIMKEPYRLENVGGMELEALGYQVTDEQKDLARAGLPIKPEILDQEIDDGLAVISFEGFSFPEKSLSARSVLIAAKSLLEKGYREVVIILPPSSKPMQKKYEIALRTAFISGVTVQRGTLDEMVSLGARAGILLTVDNGFLHIMSDVFEQMKANRGSSKRRLVEIALTDTSNVNRERGSQSSSVFLPFWRLQNVVFLNPKNNTAPSDLTPAQMRSLMAQI